MLWLLDQQIIERVEWLFCLNTFFRSYLFPELEMICGAGKGQTSPILAQVDLMPVGDLGPIRGPLSPPLRSQRERAVSRRRYSSSFQSLWPSFPTSLGKVGNGGKLVTGRAQRLIDESKRESPQVSLRTADGLAYK